MKYFSLHAAEQLLPLVHDELRKLAAQKLAQEVIDFGVSKAIGQQLTDKTIYTRFAQMILARTYYNLGLLTSDAQRPAEAEAAYRGALGLQKQLAADFPKVASCQNDLAGRLVKLANLNQQRRQFAAAVQLLEQARPHHQAALAADPKNATHRQLHRNSLRVMAECLLGLADHARLATTAEELGGLGYDPATDTYNAACYLCRCVALADKDPQLPETRRKELAQNYADRALALLRQAIVRGYEDPAHMKKVPDLQPLRARDDFKKLLADLEARSGKSNMAFQSVLMG
jgi:tetratricopeptide (TPR) repeat protein